MDMNINQRFSIHCVGEIRVTYCYHWASESKEDWGSLYGLRYQIQGEECGIGMSGYGYDPMDGFCEHSNEHTDFMRTRNIFAEKIMSLSQVTSEEY
jgi:hypothetical protein